MDSPPPSTYHRHANMRLARKITMYMLPLTIPFFIACALKKYPVILICLIPTIFSPLLGFAVLSHEKRGKNKAPSTIAMLDIFAALLYLGMLMPIWVGDARAESNIESGSCWYYEVTHGSTLMLVTYTTGFFITNMILHAYLGLTNLYYAVSAFASRPKVCPRCQASTNVPEAQSLLVPNMSPDLYSDETPRPSEETPKSSNDTFKSAQSGDMV